MPKGKINATIAALGTVTNNLDKMELSWERLKPLPQNVNAQVILFSFLSGFFTLNGCAAQPQGEFIPYYQMKVALYD
jgi:hypothetical protein